VTDNILIQIVDNKFSEFTITSLHKTNPFITCPLLSENRLLVSDLAAAGYPLPIGCLVLEKQVPFQTKIDTPKISLEEARKMMDGGTNLVITASSLINFFSVFHHKEIDQWIDQIYLAKKNNPLIKYDPSIYLFLSWIQNYSINIDQKVASKMLTFFLNITGPREVKLTSRVADGLENQYYKGLNNSLVSTILLAGGQLHEGWLFYKEAVTQRVLEKCTHLPYPFWKFEDLRNKSIVFRREHGPGDEIVYASIFRELLNKGFKILIEVDPRLTKLFERSFPSAEVVPRLKTTAHNRLLKKDINYQGNYSDAFAILRDHPKKFPVIKKYLLPEEKRITFWKEYFKKHSKTLLRVGISWNSSSSANSKQASAMTSKLEDWAPILLTPNIEFINLQYGDVNNDLKLIKKNIGVAITEVEGIDLYNDLDNLAALISTLDLIISVDNINSHLAGALGTPLWYIVPSYWFLLCGQNFAPFNRKAKLFQPSKGVYAKIAKELSAIT